MDRPHLSWHVCTRGVRRVSCYTSGVIEHLVVVGGMPGAGKTWLSRRLTNALGYGLLSRDEIKEAMYDALAKPPDVEELDWSRSVGTAAFSVFLRIAGGLGPHLILDAHFQQRFGGADDVRALAPHATQLFVHAPLEVVRQRHESRLSERHVAHRSYPLPTLGDLEAAAAFFAPLDLDGPLLEIDTSLPVDVDGVAAWVASHDPGPERSRVMAGPEASEERSALPAPSAIRDVYVVVRRHNDVLLLLRSGTGYRDGEWGPPSGKVELGETYADAAVRELYEETGLLVAPDAIRFLHIVERIPSSGSPWLGVFVEVDLESAIGTPVNREPRKHSTLQLFPISELPVGTIDYVRHVLDAVERGEHHSEWRYPASEDAR